MPRTTTNTKRIAIIGAGPVGLAAAAYALERGLIPTSLPATKQSVRDYLRAANREQEWTELTCNSTTGS